MAEHHCAKLMMSARLRSLTKWGDPVQVLIVKRKVVKLENKEPYQQMPGKRRSATQE